MNTQELCRTVTYSCLVFVSIIRISVKLFGGQLLTPLSLSGLRFPIISVYKGNDRQCLGVTKDLQNVYLLS